MAETTHSSDEESPIHYRTITAAMLQDLSEFSDSHGKFGYCSCMRWRMKSSDYHRSSKQSRARKLKQMVGEGLPVGILAYAGTEPIGWCSISPRESYEGLERYKKLSRIDDENDVWSVVCFFVDSRFRRRQVTLGLLKAGLDYARSMGVRIVEGYPVGPGYGLYTYMGSPSTFRKAGFRDVTPKGRQRKVFRFYIEHSHCRVG